MEYYTKPSYLCHHGVKGMKWGVRRYRNKDGSLTPAGKKRYSNDETTNYAKVSAKKKEVDLAKTQGLRSYVRAKRSYNIELKKRNENYSEKQRRIDKVFNGHQYVNAYLNKHENASLSKARVVSYGGMTAASVVSSVVLSKIGKMAVNSLLSRPTSDVVEKATSSDSGIFSERLGRMLTVEEAIEKGFM